MQSGRTARTASASMQRRRHQELSDLDYQWATLFRHPIIGQLGPVHQLQVARSKEMNAFISRNVLVLTVTVAAVVAFYQTASADPSKYPQFAQQSLPADVPLALISIDEL